MILYKKSLTESLTAQWKEQDRIQNRINQMYDDKLDGLIDQKTYWISLKTAKLSK